MFMSNLYIRNGFQDNVFFHLGNDFVKPVNPIIMTSINYKGKTVTFEQHIPDLDAFMSRDGLYL